MLALAVCCLVNAADQIANKLQQLDPVFLDRDINVTQKQ
jgi:hypothetical protein